MSGRNEGPDDERSQLETPSRNRRDSCGMPRWREPPWPRDGRDVRCELLHRGKETGTNRGRTLVIVDRDLKAQLCRIWNDH